MLCYARVVQVLSPFLKTISFMVKIITNKSPNKLEPCGAIILWHVLWCFNSITLAVDVQAIKPKAFSLATYEIKMFVENVRRDSLSLW